MRLCKKCQKNPVWQYDHYCRECQEKRKREVAAYRKIVFPRYLSREALVRNAGIVLRDHNTCQRCKIWNPNEILVVHHIIPVREGGSDEDNNLIALCKHCHAVIHNKIGATMDALFPGEEEMLLERAYKAIYESKPKTTYPLD